MLAEMCATAFDNNVASGRGKAVMDLLRRLGREREAAVIVVTHDDRMLEGFDRVSRMIDGRIDIGERIDHALGSEALVSPRNKEECSA